MMELLAPAGSPEAVTAAVENGADAVYLGFGSFNARRGAKNFSQEEFGAAVSYCRLRGVKTYLTLNTLQSDRELPFAAVAVETANALGVDAVLVQDLGVLRMVRQVAPELPVHASTQMSIHNLEGVRKAAALGISRVVLARELSREEIARIAAASPVQLEVFVHGALCMCYSGQCYLSSVIGGRSGNRGLCAQPCRMAYGWGLEADRHPLSLKDLSLVRHLRELDELGVACVKIEGRMKRPDYVSVVTSIYANALRTGRDPSPEDFKRLSAVFSRQGFTDGFFVNSKGPHMLGVREEAPFKGAVSPPAAPREAPAPRQVPVSFYCILKAGEPLRLAVQDEAGRVCRGDGPAPEPAVNRALTKEQIETALRKTGGTPFVCQTARIYAEEGLSLPISAVNALRRTVLEALEAERKTPPDRKTGAYQPGVRFQNRPDPPVLTVSVSHMAQLSKELLALSPALVYVPLEEAAGSLSKVEALCRAGTPLAVSMPRILWDSEWPEVLRQLDAVRSAGIAEALTGNLGQIDPLRERGFALRGDFGLNAYNSQTLKELKRQGFCSATLSFELRFAQIRDISKSLDTEALVYGRLPLMITESCLLKNRTGRCSCGGAAALTDRTGARFPVIRESGCRSVLLNSRKLFLADRQKDYRKLGLWGVRLQFTTENPRECLQVAKRYLGQGAYEPGEYTRGLYYREVE